jgi:hypothetical protein
MITKKFNLNWQSVLLGMVLCMVLVVFIGSKPAPAQAGTSQGTLQRPANITDVWDKTNVIDQRLIHLQSSIDETYKEILRLRKALGR